MHSRRVSLIAFVILAISSMVAFAADPELKPGQSLDSSLSPGQTQSFVISLDCGEFAQIGVTVQGHALVLKTYTPSGKPFRGTEVGPQGGTLNLVAEAAGAYRVEVTTTDKSAAEGLKITIALQRVVPLAARLVPKPVVESPRIQALRASAENDRQRNADLLWEEIKKTGAPLIDPINGDQENMAVTFLWRGTPETHNVLVLWLPWLGVTPDEFFMERVDGTDVWYKTIKVDRKMRLAYTLASNVGRIRPVPLGMDGDAINMGAAAARPDPLNPKRYRCSPQSVDAPEYCGNSILEMPGAAPQPWTAKRTGVPVGRIEKHRYQSAAMGNEREIGVYLPPSYSQGAKPYPLLVLFDAHFYLGDETREPALVPTPTILDNLIADERIPPMVALFIGNAPGARERELGCNPEFTKTLVKEVLPWAHARYNFTNDPSQTVIGGSSLGGFAATCAGLWQPETFGNVLAQSGPFYRTAPSGGDSTDSSSDENWVARQFISAAKKPVRFYLDAGSGEFTATIGAESTLSSTRALRDVLRAKGYEVHYQEFAGGHDYLSWRGTLADGLTALIGIEKKEQHNGR